MTLFAEVNILLAKFGQSKADLVLMLLDELVTSMVYTPPEVHNYPILFGVRLTLLAAAKLELFMDVVKGSLWYTEHPLYTQHGWDLPPTVLVPITTTPAPNTLVGDILRPGARWVRRHNYLLVYRLFK